MFCGVSLVYMIKIVGFLVGGAFGALARELVRDNSIQLPVYRDKKILLGSLGGMIVGAFVGYVVDHSIMTALLSGYVGVSTISHLLPTDSKK